jgi:hypothetical protein
MIFSGAGTAVFRKRYGLATGEVGPRRRLFDLKEAGGWSGIKEAAAFRAGAGAELENVLCGANDGFIVFYHEDGVAGLPEFPEEAQQAVGVAGMESDAGFVEDEEGAGEAGAQTPGQVDPLEFSSGEGAGGAVEGEVAQPHPEKKAETFPNVFQRGQGGVIPGFDFREKFGEFAEG